MPWIVRRMFLCIDVGEIGGVQLHEVELTGLSSVS
jgi:hypothetical protein